LQSLGFAAVLFGSRFIVPKFERQFPMARSGVITFKGNPLTLAGDAVAVGQDAPDFNLHYFEDGMQTVGLADVKGKPTILSVVPSLDTPVCAMQTKKFNEALGQFGDSINALTVSLDLPFAMNRFCGAEDITNIRSASDYQDRNFGQSFGTLIEELKIMCRAIFVLDAAGKVTHAEYVPEVTDEPNYDAALDAVKGQL
jgi:thiol peroxidase